MQRLAPEIFRQRLLLEGFFTIEVNGESLSAYLLGLAAHLGMRAYAAPTIHAPGGLGKAENQGYDAFLPLIDSGVAAYVWTGPRFFSIVVYTCKAFDPEAAIDYTLRFFAATAVESMAF